MKYTGNTDPSDGPRAGTEKFVEIVTKRYGFTNLGIWANRPMRGTNPPRLSVHATGRACDIGYSDPAVAAKFALWLVANAETLGIEEVHDYSGITKKGTGRWGRGWRCERKELGGKAGWKNWTATDNGGSAGGKWLHIELTPDIADNPRKLVQIWKTLEKPQ